MSISLTDPRKLRALVEEAAPAFTQALPTAQADVGPDVSLLTSTIADYRSALESAGYDITKLQPDLVSKLQSPLVVGATIRLEGWAKKAC